ncbi:MAG: asparagine synthase B [Thermoanaerobaculia bacterium]|nr:asparagine synthase B [Thermoanaerobaculia bacterium]
MCSIFALLDLVTPADGEALRGLLLECSRRQRHRGPDWSGVYTDEGALLAHERLAIVDVDNGAQPLRSADGRRVLAVNGEIYNHRALRDRLTIPYEFQTGSDCEVILGMFPESVRAADRNAATVRMLEALNGIFAFVLWDADEDRYLVARDPIGVIPLYWGRDEQGRRVVASEMKALYDVCGDFEAFPPGHFFDSRGGVEGKGELIRYYRPLWRRHSEAEASSDQAAAETAAAARIRDALDAAVARQLMTDVPYGVLLSGGLDSSVIAALAAQHARRRVETDEREEAWWPRLHTFAVGLEGSPDLAAARKVADHLETVHHEMHYTIQEGLDALRDVIWHIETFDVTTIRASTPMYLMARRIKAMGVKMVLSGEGSDEIFGGYLYFHKAPDAEEFHAETVRKLDALHLFDCLRANKSMAAWGVEARVPFLDREFLDVAMAVPALFKMTQGAGGTPRIEKHVLRLAVEDLLPHDVVWRQKEQFSDGVGYGWIDSLRALAEEQVSDDELRRAEFRFPRNTPATKEAYLYRSLFAEQFPSEAAVATVPGGKSIACSSPVAIAWDASFGANADPSGRAIRDVHVAEES